MFKADNPNIIVSDEGFSVQVLGRTGLRYQEGNRALRIDSEVLAHPHGIMMYQSSIKAWSEPAMKPIDDDERRVIVHNIRRAFAFRNVEVVVI